MLTSHPVQKLASARVPKNRLLAALPEHEWRHLKPHFKFGALNSGAVLYEEGTPIQRVYFLDEGMISLVLSSKEGTVVEVGVAGPEGMAGAEAATGADATARAIVQVPGAGWQLPAPIFAQAAQGGSRLQGLLLEYWQFVAAQNAQAALCNRLHSIEQRLCRWLLLVRDRVGADEFALTQEFLAQMLGVQRPGVSIAASALRAAGLIHYSRGQISLLDVPGLEAAACECHATLHKRFLQLVEKKAR